MRVDPSMTRGVMGAVLGLVLGWSTPGCSPSGAFTCQSDDQCGAGSCVGGYCAFDDGECESGQRYGALAGALAGECVPVSGGSTSGGSTSAQTQGGTSMGGSDPTLTSASASSSTTDGTTSMVDPTQSSTSSDATSSDATGSDSTGVQSTATTGPPPIVRVTEGILAYYRPDQIDSGDAVPDVSGVDPALDMTLMGEGFTWASDGLRTSGEGIVVALGSASKIRNGCQATDELTVEVWITPDNDQLVGPARVVTYSEDSAARNFTLAQGATVDDPMGWTARVRTTTTDNNGIPNLSYAAAVGMSQVHVVFAREAAGDSVLYIDGIEVEREPIAGDFSGWSTSSTYQFAWGNEISLNRPWEGTFHLVAVYERALSSAEVAQNFAAGL